MKNKLLLSIALFFSVSLFAQKKLPADKWQTTSPNGLNTITVLNRAGQLHYFVTQGSDTIIQTSLLGITGENISFENKLQFISATQKKIDEKYVMYLGKRRLNHNLANEMVLRFVNKDKQPMQLQLRAYNDGVAFRYFFPTVKPGTTVTKEGTNFNLPTTGNAWLMPYGLPTDWAPAYENNYTNGSAIGQPSPDSSGWAFPALFRSNNYFILITEAGLDENYFAAHLQQQSIGGEYKIAQPLQGEALGKYTTNASVQQSFATPWRTVIFGKNLGTIIESNLVHHLSAPNKIGDASWVKPGRSSWSWWGDHASSKNFTTLKKFVDLAKTMGWEYSLVDANWDIMEDGGSIEDLVQYANTQKVLLTLWYNSGGPHNTVTERPRDIMSDAVKRKAEFKKLNAWGVKAIKVDFFNSDKQEIIKLYLDILKDAAAAKIMVVFHGCTLPRGWSRTYPNLISMEAIKGAEQYGWDSAFAANTPQHNIIAMCTRNVVGPMDYTPVTFSDYDCCKHTTSNAYELATSVLFESGMLHFADRIAPFLALSYEIKNFLKIVPVTWDDTKFLDGYPGKLMVMARQKGNDWFVAAANGETVEKNISVDLSFLPKGKYTLQIMKDGAHSREITTEIINYIAGSPLSIKVLGNGGFVVWVKRG
jgi:hypothetical protein